MSPLVLFRSLVLGGLALAAVRPAGAVTPYPGKQPTKDADRATVAPGGTIQWTITIYNDALPDIATVNLKDDVPDPADFPGPPAPATVLPWVLAADLDPVPAPSIPTYDGDVLTIPDFEIAGRASQKIVFRTHVDPAAVDGTKICNSAQVHYAHDNCPTPTTCFLEEFDSLTRPSGAAAAAPTCVTVGVVVGAPDVRADLATTLSTHSCGGDRAFPVGGGIARGETVNLTLAVRNQGPVDAPALPVPITGTLQAGTGFTIVTGSQPYTTTATPDTLLANSANLGTNSAPFVVRVDPGITCPGRITIPLVVSQVKGGPFNVDYTNLLSVSSCGKQCLDVDIAPGTSTFTDACSINPPGSNGKTDPGDRLSFTFPVTNSGREPLAGAPTVTGTLAVVPAVTGINVVVASQPYPDLAPTSTQVNAIPFEVQLADNLACGTAFNLQLTLDGTNAGFPRTFDFPMAVASPCTACKLTTVCTSSAVATAPGNPLICPGSTLTLDGGSSSLSNCSGTKDYQWFQGATLIAGATASTYALPTTLAPGPYAYSVEVTCSTQPSCTSRSSPVAITVEPQPLLARRLLGKKSGTNAVFSWTLEATATGGYRLYYTPDKKLVMTARAGTSNTFAAGTTAVDPNATTLTHTNALGLPDTLLHYQTLALCLDQVLEGPN